MTTTYMRMHRYNKDADLSSSNVFRNEEKAKTKNMFANRSLQSNLERERGIEKMHMETIRREQVMLQKELQKVRTKGQYLNGNRPVVRQPNRLRHIGYRHERRNKATEGAGAQLSDKANNTDSGFPSINVTSKQLSAKSTPLQREYDKKMQLLQKESNREQAISQRRLNEMSRRQEKLVARVADLAEGLKHATTSGKETASFAKGGKYDKKQSERKMSHQEKVASNLKTLPSIFSSPIPNKVSLSDSPQTARRLEAPILANATPALTGNSLHNGQESNVNTQAMVADIIANPTLWFDQHKYAPDGGLRTIHLLPDSDDTFHEAKKARYLRWKDPQSANKELSVGEIFAQTKKGKRRQSQMVDVSVVRDK
ncbi:uncharacterized protein LOC117118661 [Anneissia japonica]|uniref:uncharacterized protein LOC117118661 n=1 Tax=Anneissia japonica TaxID=1529436 RepID=UPI0014258D41|nr:uncharacterized protein LOC117118661 [Anneissia japonica]XP_033119217.1 uncharacterized protein LOC117118661 [Anneissia japonica]XP_033119218.1 uncharacterized protein LOC117118661 [Anneissia japonica]